ncbi:hypothetical protein [Paenibacillus dendritiformis]|uniref:hypothetical protein n=1 Tax=Paenibacillus dendritiformis TaxID=130049 RepID=UPI0020C540A1|nr:hypothetical protein [Paenibacillus dendritiformis]CAH8768852.1 hypothetical protein H7S4_001550 [Paenibacillus dendritiformis]
MLRDRVELLAHEEEAVRDAFGGRQGVAEGVVLVAVDDAAQTVRDVHDVAVLVVQVVICISLAVHLG